MLVVQQCSKEEEEQHHLRQSRNKQPSEKCNYCCCWSNENVEICVSSQEEEDAFVITEQWCSWCLGLSSLGHGGGAPPSISESYRLQGCHHGIYIYLHIIVSLLSDELLFVDCGLGFVKLLVLHSSDSHVSFLASL